MTGYRQRMGFLIAMVGCLLLVHLAVWAQQPRPGGTLRVAWNVKGHVHLHGYKVRFETTWLDKP